MGRPPRGLRVKRRTFAGRLLVRATIVAAQNGAAGWLLIKGPGQPGKRRTKARAASATSRQPLSMTSAWPRPDILAISVTAWLCFCRWYEALAIAQGTVWSFSP